MLFRDVSIVIPSYNNAAGLVRLLTSCEQLDYKEGQFEVIVVDDGSTDKTVELLKDYEFSFPLNLVSLPENSGRSVARNRGLEAAKYDIVLFIDSDMEVSPDLVQSHMEEYENEETLGVMGEFYLPKFVKKSRWFRYLDGETRGARLWRRRNPEAPFLPFYLVMTANLSVRKDKALEVGGLDEKMKHYGGEDMEFAFRLTRKNKGGFKYQPQAITYHQHRPFRDTLKLLNEYGRKVIPYIIAKHPDLYYFLPSRLVKTEGFSVNGKQRIAQLFVAVLIQKPGLYLARALRLIAPDAAAFRMIQIIMLYHVLMGYRKSLKLKN